MGPFPALTGDPHAIQLDADAHRAAADSISQAAGLLRTIANSNGTVSEAVDAMRQRMLDLSTEITKAKVRYEGVADALQIYATKLRNAQDLAQAARTKIQSVQTSLNYAVYWRDHYHDELRNPADPEYAENHRRYVNYRNQANDLNDDLAAATTSYWAAAEDKNRAALDAMQSINDAADASDLNDSLWDVVVAGWTGLQNFVTENAEFFSQLQEIVAAVAEVLSTISTILTILALIPIPGLNAVLAGLALTFAVASLVLSVVSLILTALLIDSGKRTVGDLISSAITVAVSVLSVVGAGKAVKLAAERPLSSLAGAVLQDAQEEMAADIAKDLSIEFLGNTLGDVSEAVGNALTPNPDADCMTGPAFPVVLELPHVGIEMMELGDVEIPVLDIGLGVGISINPEIGTSVQCMLADA
jgi:hypothetical protein